MPNTNIMLRAGILSENKLNSHWSCVSSSCVAVELSYSAADLLATPKTQTQDNIVPCRGLVSFKSVGQNRRLPVWEIKHANSFRCALVLAITWQAGPCSSLVLFVNAITVTLWSVTVDGLSAPMASLQFDIGVIETLSNLDLGWLFII